MEQRLLAILNMLEDISADINIDEDGLDEDTLRGEFEELADNMRSIKISLEDVQDGLEAQDDDETDEVSTAIDEAFDAIYNADDIIDEALALLDGEDDEDDEFAIDGIDYEAVSELISNLTHDIKSAASAVSSALNIFA